VTRYLLYRQESRAPGDREYLHHVVTLSGERLAGFVELPTQLGAVEFEPAHAVIWMHRDKRLMKEEVE
jgi:hypothetical protein